MVAPGATADAEAACVIERSAPATCTEAVALLFARFDSVPVWLIVTVLEIVEAGKAVDATARTTVNVALVPPANVPVGAQEIRPVPPTAGCVPQVHPAGGVTD